MPVSPVDPSEAQPTPHWIAHLHAAQLSVMDAGSGQKLLDQFWTLLRQRTESAITALPTEAARLRVSLGVGEPPTLADGQALVEQGERLDAISDTLSDSYDQMLTAMFTQGRQAIKNSLLYQGRERAEELRDGVRLLRGVIANAIGSRNYAAWFELGWALWTLGEPLAEVEEAFYQAARLSGASRDLYHYLALRYEAYIQSLLGKPIESRATAQRFLTEASTPELLLEAARYEQLSGRTTEALELIQRIIDQQPSLVFAVFADPDLTPIHGATSNLVERATQAARQAAARDIDRLRIARGLKDRLLNELNIRMELPDGEVPLPADSCSLFEARRLGQTAGLDAKVVIDKVIEAVSQAERQNTDVLRRFKLQIDQAVSEKAYWEGSIKNVEEEARIAGYSLHPYTFHNPFQRSKNQRAENARVLYMTCKQNLERIESFTRDHLPAMEAACEKHAQRGAQLEAMLEWLRAQQ